MGGALFEELLTTVLDEAAERQCRMLAGEARRTMVEPVSSSAGSAEKSDCTQLAR